MQVQTPEQQTALLNKGEARRPGTSEQKVQVRRVEKSLPPATTCGRVEAVDSVERGAILRSPLSHSIRQ